MNIFSWDVSKGKSTIESMSSVSHSNYELLSSQPPNPRDADPMRDSEIQ